MKVWLEAAGMLIAGFLIAICAAVFLMVTAGQMAWNALGDEDGQHRG